MGVLFSRFRRKQTTIEILEGIDKDINRLQRNRKVNQDRQKQFVTSLLIYSIIVYILAAIIFFCVYFPDTWKLRLLYSLPLLIFPFLIWGIKKLLHWYFVKRITSNDLALQELREKKKQILEDVMETETYKKAIEILEKFDPARLRKLEIGSQQAGSVVTVTGTPGTVIQQRTVKTVQHVRGMTPAPTRMPSPGTPNTTISATRLRQPMTPIASTPGLPPQPRTRASPQVRTPFPAQPVVRGGLPSGYAVTSSLPMPRSVLPRERGTMDRLVDYLVGDGPENRYALICQQCHSHNGMALKEEYEYLSFRCCYCYTLNMAKKQRPLAPRLEFFAPAGSKKCQGAGQVPSNEESDDDDVDNEDEEYSDQDSMESDTSAGISPIQSVKSPDVSPLRSGNSSMVLMTASSKPSPVTDSSQGKHKEDKDSKPHNSQGQKSDDVKKSKQDEVKELNQGDIKGQQPQAAVGPSSGITPRPKQTERPASKVTGQQTSNVSRIPQAQLTKVVGSHASVELRDSSQTSRTPLKEGLALPETVPGKSLSKPGEAIHLPISAQTQPAGLRADQPAVNTKKATPGDRCNNRNDDADLTQGALTEDTHTSGGTSVSS